MSLRAEDECPIPEATRRVARAAFPRGTLCMRLADRLGPLHRDEQYVETAGRVALRAIEAMPSSAAVIASRSRGPLQQQARHGPSGGFAAGCFADGSLRDGSATGSS